MKLITMAGEAGPRFMTRAGEAGPRFMNAVYPLILIAGSLAANSAMAQGQIQLGVPAYGGNGCPAGSAAATLSPDGKSLSILFDQYGVEAGGTSGRSVDRKSCNVSIPIAVPEGFSVSIFKIDYRGYNSIPFGGSSQFNVEYFFAGSQGPRFQRSFSGPLNNDFLLTNEVIATSQVWTPCGEDVNMRLNTSLVANTNANYQQTMATIDSADISSAVVFQIAYRQCGYAPAPQPTYPPAPQPTYPPAPQPTYPPAPQPTYPPTYPPTLQDCRIDQGYDAYGMVVYNVRDRYGRVIAQARDYNTALQTALYNEQNGNCRGGFNPNPYPPTPPPSRTTCTIASGRNAYGQTLYRVLTRSSAIIYTTTNYADAVRVQQSNAACLR